MVLACAWQHGGTGWQRKKEAEQTPGGSWNGRGTGVGAEGRAWEASCIGSAWAQRSARAVGTALAVGSGLLEPQGWTLSWGRAPFVLQAQARGNLPFFPSWEGRWLTDSYHSPVIGSTWKVVPISSHWCSDGRDGGRPQSSRAKPMDKQAWDGQWRKQNRQEIGQKIIIMMITWLRLAFPKSLPSGGDHSKMLLICILSCGAVLSYSSSYIKQGNWGMLLNCPISLLSNRRSWVSNPGLSESDDHAPNH